MAANGDSGEPDYLRKIFIGALTPDTDDEKLKEFYSQWGEVVDVVVVRDTETKKSRGFGFVTYNHMSCVDDAMANRPHTVDGKKVDPKRAVPKEKAGSVEASMQVKKLFVGGIKDNHTDDMLKEYFSQHGTIESVAIISDKETGKRRGFAFVNFDDCDPVDKMCLLKNHEIGGQNCEVKKALSRDELGRAKQQQRESGFRAERSGRGMRGGFRGGRGGGNGGWGAGYGAGGYGAGWGGQGGYGGGGYGGMGMGGGWGQQGGWGGGYGGDMGGGWGQQGGGYGYGY